jgi:sugar-specific transcriptional regulator TrmB
MNPKIYSILKDFGLSEKEIQIYFILVENGEQNAYFISKITGIHRSTTYDVLDKLIEKGFVNKITKDKKTLFFAVNLDETISKFKVKELLLSSLAPELEKIKKKETSNVNIIKTPESQKQFSYNLFNKIIKGDIKELLILSGGSMNPNETKSSDLFIERLLKELNKQKNKIKYRGIWNEKFKKTSLIKLFNNIGENKFLDKLPTQATTIIFEDSLVYMFTLSDEPQVIEIQNKLIAEENKAYFDYLWKIAKK